MGNTLDLLLICVVRIVMADPRCLSLPHSLPDPKPKKFVFVHNPKTGGETVETLLKYRKNHLHASQMKNKLKNGYSFVFVRHPVTRLTSWYNHLLKHRHIGKIPNNQLNNSSECYRLLKRHKKMRPDSHRILAEKHNINDWIRIMFKHK